jgi:hypothetical protein
MAVVLALLAMEVGTVVVLVAILGLKALVRGPLTWPRPFRESRSAASRDIPFNRLVLSQSNVRRVKAGLSIEELAEDIARRGVGLATS